jgi:hypothetical protein
MFPKAVKLLGVNELLLKSSMDSWGLMPPLGSSP